MFPVLMLVSVNYQRSQAGPMKRAQEAVGDLTTIVHESVDGAVVVKAFGAAALERERFDRQAETLRQAKLVTVRQRARFTAIFGLIPNLASLLLLVVGAYRVRSGAVTLGDVSSVLYLFTLLVWPLAVVGYMMGDMTHGYSGWVRVRAMLDSANPSAILPGVPPAGEAVSLRGVGFAYEDGRDVLNEVHLSPCLSARSLHSSVRRVPGRRRSWSCWPVFAHRTEAPSPPLVERGAWCFRNRSCLPVLCSTTLTCPARARFTWCNGR
jgi:ABC-type multidrug transport system fused ATPase/permease subunit